MNEPNDAEGALAAMTRAAEAARVRATRFGSRLAIWKDGEVVLVTPQKNSAEQGTTEEPAAASESQAEVQKNPKPETESRPQ